MTLRTMLRMTCTPSEVSAGQHALLCSLRLQSGGALPDKRKHPSRANTSMSVQMHVSMTKCAC